MERLEDRYGKICRFIYIYGLILYIMVFMFNKDGYSCFYKM